MEMDEPKPTPPKNGVYIVQGEMLLVVTAIRRSSKWTTHLPQEEEQDPLLSNFSQLKDVLNNVSDLQEIEPNVFLGPFLDVIRSEDTTGPITGLALSSVNKFLSYGLLEANNDRVATGIENIADAVTHARFIGTDTGSDEVVLMKILQVLRTLLLTPVGAFLSNESVCEIMQSCFRICFETRLSELLRKSAEHTLIDMVQLLFARLPHFREEKIPGLRKVYLYVFPHLFAKQLKMRAGGISETSRKRQPKSSPKSSKKKERQVPGSSEDKEKSSQDTAGSAQSLAVGQEEAVSESSETSRQSKEGLGSQESISDVVEGGTESCQEQTQEEREERSLEEEDAEEKTQGERPSTLEVPEIGVTDEDSEVSGAETPQERQVISMHAEQSVEDFETKNYEQAGGESTGEGAGEMNEDGESGAEQSDSASQQDSEYYNSQGVRFTPQQRLRHDSGPPVPYGLPCVRELFRFLISLVNPYDRHNNELMMHMGLSLLTVALETGSDHISASPSLLSLVKDDMCKNLFAVVPADRLTIFASALRVCFLLFESMRTHLKLQLEMFLQKLMDIIASESPRISYEQREMAVDTLVQLWRIPSFVGELYINYDCAIYCSNLFEDLTKLLSKNAFPVSGSLYTTHLLSLDALLAVIDSIEENCQHRIMNGMRNGHSNHDDEVISFVAETDSGIKVQVTSEGSVGERERTDSDLSGPQFPVPPTTGYAMASKVSSMAKGSHDSANGHEEKPTGFTKTRKISRYSASPNLPTVEQIFSLKQKKKIITTGCDLFNQKASKGIAYLQEKGILRTPMDPDEVAQFVRDGPGLDKKVIGEYLSAKKNAKVLEAFMRTFQFEMTRIDEALRMFLETFRLPGEAPVIQHVLEHFADFWHNCNNHPFVDNDAAFTLAYAVIMLNVDQHNHNAKKQNIPMTLTEFRKNLKKVNGGSDFNQEMLEELYNAIKSEEIVMPAEQTGLVKENYLWRCLLKRGMSPDTMFLHTGRGMYDKDLFLLTWGATVAALSYVYDKSADDAIMQKALTGFRKCAMISAHYGLTDVFDNLVISICKYSTLLNSPESPESLAVMFGGNPKAQLAAKMVFSLAHRHGDILSEGWKNLLDCMLQLFRAKLLPKNMIEVEDFVNPKGKVSLIQEELPAAKTDQSYLSFFSVFMAADTSQQKSPSPEDQEAIEKARSCIEDCQPELLIKESKFLRLESLQELVKALCFASMHESESITTPFDEEAAVFNLEMLISLVLENRDRVMSIWQTVCDHLYSIIVATSEFTYLVERAVVGLLRTAIRLLRKEDISGQILASLKMLLMMKVSVLRKVCRQIASGLYELLRTNAANIHTSEDWYTLFTLLECVGAGTNPPAMMRIDIQEPKDDTEPLDSGAQSDSELSVDSHESRDTDHGYTSDSELYRKGSTYSHASGHESDASTGSSGWLVVNRDGKSAVPENQFEIVLSNKITFQDTKALKKCCESLAFLVRDAAHVTPANFEACVHAIRTFVEATLNGGKVFQDQRKLQQQQQAGKDRKGKKSQKNTGKILKTKSVPEAMSKMTDWMDEMDGDSAPGGYHSLSIQLLDLMHTLHTRAASIFSSWAEEEQREGRSRTVDAGTSALWVKCWCPLLQGIARLCCDMRRQVRMQALTYLQRALLVHDLQTLSALEWESCFNKVLFPLLSKLLENNSPDPVEMEETRMRAANLLCKGFLQHLTPLLSLPTFTALWMTILDFMDKYMHADKSELLSEAIPESLKNMLLVMDTAGVFQTDGSPDDPAAQLWTMTWERIHYFLPGLKEEVFKPHEPARVTPPATVPSQAAIPRDGGGVTPGNSDQTTQEKPEATGESTAPPAQQEPTPEEPPVDPPKSEAPPVTQPTIIPPTTAHLPGPTPNLPTIGTQSNIILQPPLPTLVPPGSESSKSQVRTIPLLLDPAVLQGMQGTQLPIMSLKQNQATDSRT
ncbi:Golgi-specific brefeldin A-resistance guanine nucleotide exchange factor 1 [Holothuria leucospilota]|uniref:Golgi-specific brefeldin A-resistance guanine nucleotide exchange factor 1 n=1 Tax=Holothuria leucospilota TaxID=206669 RepID=A0A9Q1BF01_HOLLE|nr:Golgi-specific brefeldin A-resistance guanine nucleotide exchange factor 1 [Holothuria leucospilota]